MLLKVLRDSSMVLNGTLWMNSDVWVLRVFCKRYVLMAPQISGYCFSCKKIKNKHLPLSATRCCFSHAVLHLLLHSWHWIRLLAANSSVTPQTIWRRGDGRSFASSRGRTCKLYLTSASCSKVISSKLVHWLQLELDRLMTLRQLHRFRKCCHHVIAFWLCLKRRSWRR